MSGLLFGSCCGASTDHNNDDHTEDGYFQCPTVPYLLPHDVKAQAAQSSPEAAADSDNNKRSIVSGDLHGSKISGDGQNSSSFLLRGAQHYHRNNNNNRNSARRLEAAARQIVRPMLLQGSTLSKHTGSSPGGVRTEPTTDDDDDDSSDDEDDDEDDDDDDEQVEALVNLCVRDCEAADCVADPEFEHDDHRFRQHHAFGLAKDSSGLAALLPPHMRKRSIPLYQELQQQGHALWNQHPDIKFLPIHDEDGDPLPSTICVYRPKLAWPKGDVRIRWALSRNTSPTSALVLERWTAAVVLSPPPPPTATSSSDTLEVKDELPTRMLTLEDIDYTTARLDGTVEVHDETTCTTQETNQHKSSSSTSTTATTPSDNRREIAWLTCYRIVFHDDHDDDNNNNNSRDVKKHGRGAAARSSTLIPSSNGTAGFSARKLETRNFFSQFDDARHGPLKQYIRDQQEREAQEHQHHQDQRDSRSSSRDGCASPCTTGSIVAQSRSKSHDPSTEAASSTSRGGGGAGGGSFCHSKKSQQYFVVQSLAVHDDYRGLGIGLCLLDDACRRICDPEAWVLVSIPPNPSSLPATLPRTKKARFRHFSFGRPSWSLSSSASSIGSSKRSTRSEKREAAAAAAAASSSRPVSTVPTNPNPETLMDYLGLLGFERLDGSPFCVRWNENESLPRIEEVCPHVPVFCPPPESC